MFAKRPQVIRKLYLAEARIPQMQPLLKWCVANRVGYRVVEDADLQKLAASTHHEGVVADVLREDPLPLSTWLRDLPAGPQCALWLDGVGNPHNLGAILRSASLHFRRGRGAAAQAFHAGAFRRGGARGRRRRGRGAVRAPGPRGQQHRAIARRRFQAGRHRGARRQSKAAMPQRVVYVLGAEAEGMSPDLKACDLRLSIPGSGAAGKPQRRLGHGGIALAVGESRALISVLLLTISPPRRRLRTVQA